MEANNVEAMREALRAALDLIFDMQNADRSPLSNQAYAVRRKIKAALAAPPRNCEVGTAEEQAERFARFCGKQQCDCVGCPFSRTDNRKCPFLWMQAPHTTEGGAK